MPAISQHAIQRSVCRCRRHRRHKRSGEEALTGEREAHGKREARRHMLRGGTRCKRHVVPQVRVQSCLLNHLPPSSVVRIGRNTARNLHAGLHHESNPGKKEIG
jgi:hypothetical protein